MCSDQVIGMLLKMAASVPDTVSLEKISFNCLLLTLLGYERLFSFFSYITLVLGC